MCLTTNFWAVVEWTGSIIQCYVVLLLFLLVGRKEHHEEVKSCWSAQSGLKWQHSNFYIMPQPSNLFCHTAFIFDKSNMLISFNPLNRKLLREHVTPHDFPVEQRHITHLKCKGLKFKGHTHQSIGRTFSKKKSFSWQMGELNSLGKLMRGCCSTWRIND